MIFPKEYITKSLEEKVDKLVSQAFPFETLSVGDDRTPFGHTVRNYVLAFDLKSNQMKELMYKARKEIVDKCYNDHYLGDVYPNELKIKQCIKNTELKYLGKYWKKRDQYFGNIRNHAKESLENIPLSNNEIHATKTFEAIEQLVWDSFKAKYFIKEQYDKI